MGEHAFHVAVALRDKVFEEIVVVHGTATAVEDIGSHWDNG